MFHLGCDFFCDKDGNLCYAPNKYIEKILDEYERLFGSKPKQYTSPLIKGDHPEVDSSDLLDFKMTKIYQSLIGALQWVIQIGRFDVQAAVMTLSQFRAAQHLGHINRVKRIYGYLSKMRHAIIRIRTSELDYSAIPEKIHSWSSTCYPDAKEAIPHDAPTPKGKSIRATACFNANLYHDLISGRSVTGILHLLNKTPIDWFSKLQSTVKTATYGSEFVAARTCTEQIIALRLTLRYLGVPINGPTMITSIVLLLCFSIRGDCKPKIYSLFACPLHTIYIRSSLLSSLIGRMGKDHIDVNWTQSLFMTAAFGGGSVVELDGSVTNVH